MLGRPDWGAGRAARRLCRSFPGTQSVVLAAGILGATVMPHVIFLHSALMQGRIVVRDPQQMKRLFRYEVIDVVIAMGVAGLINAAMLDHGRQDLPRGGADRRRRHREGLPDAGATAGTSGEFRLRHLAAGRRPVQLRGRDDERAGDHAGLPRSTTFPSGSAAA